MTANNDLRRDAARNRERILEAARELFERQGLSITLDDVARHAGVGVGTVYRRFANKQALLDELMADVVAQLRAIAQAALAVPDAWEGLRLFILESCALQARHRGIRDLVFRPALMGDKDGEQGQMLIRVLTELTSRAQQQGSLRPEITVSDLWILHQAQSFIMERSEKISPGLYQRYANLFLDAISLSPPARPLTPGLTPAQLKVFLGQD